MADIGNMNAMREALDKIQKLVTSDSPADEIEIANICYVALAKPPRNCDVMSPKAARKVWFAKEIMPRLTGDLPLGKEVPFEEWFVAPATGQKGDSDGSK